MFLRITVALVLFLVGNGSAQASSADKNSVRLQVVVHVVPAAKLELTKVISDAQSDWEYDLEPAVDCVTTSKDLSITMWKDDEHLAPNAALGGRVQSAALTTTSATIK